MLPMPPLSPLRRLRVVPRALLTRRSPPLRLRSPAATPPTRRSTGCSVARSRSKSLLFKDWVLCENAALCAAFFFAHQRSDFHEPPNLVDRSGIGDLAGGKYRECSTAELFVHRLRRTTP